MRIRGPPWATKPAEAALHDLTILRRCVTPVLDGIHRRRLDVLLEAVAATVSG
jgi:hypothetical protein